VQELITFLKFETEKSHISLGHESINTGKTVFNTHRARRKRRGAD
jgi:hypothetical protein